MKFYIYEVPGHKNGCTTQLNKRSNQNLNKYGIMPILIETYNYPDEPEYWQIVGDREWELAEMNGYSKGQHYRIAREQRILAGKSGGSKKSESKTIASRQNGALGGKLGGHIVGTKQGAVLHTCSICGKYPLKGNAAINSHMRMHKNNLDVNLCSKLVSN